VRVCILAAGMGTRSGPVGDFVHKALLPLGNRAVLSHLFDRFPAGTQFTIAVGNKAAQIESFVALAHPDVDVRFVAVDRYTGPGSGPGRSLFCCKAFLQEPFAFIACDTLITGELPAFEGNWLGVTPVSDPGNWCTVSTDAADQVRSLHYKDANTDAHMAFTGLGFVQDVEMFWAGLESSMGAQGECQVNEGLAALIGRGLHCYPLDWADTGTWENYQAAAKRFEKNLSFLGKTTELTYHYGDAILKLYPSEEKAQRCVQRGQEMGDAVPRILGRQGPLVSFEFVANKLLSEGMNAHACRSFLEWAEAAFWKPRQVDAASFQRATREFYVDKTLQRVRDFESSDPAHPDLYQRGTWINGTLCQPIKALVESVADTLVQGALPSTLHGDLHADNILVTQGGYRLIDWRDSYAGLDVGDRYYDLAKFLHTLELSVQTMDRREFKLQISEEGVQFSHRCDYSDWMARDAFYAFAQARGYSANRIAILNAMVFINMAPLYDPALGAYLYWLGRYQLNMAIASSSAIARS
jgi:dTDP-glucose pyrophosphorylase